MIHWRRLLIVIFVFKYYPAVILCQDCRDYSKTCNDPKDCCGGCCLNGICRDMYTDCRMLENDPCLEIYCPPNEDCYIFQPQDCGGCGPIVDCRPISSSEERSLADSFSHHSNTENKIASNSGLHGKINSYILCSCLINLYFVFYKLIAF